jgi:monomeric sarcosine oxidase
MARAEYEFAVIGAGAMGSAAAYQLAKQGRSVLLLEQFEIGHERGSSHGESRIIRLSYDHPVYIRLARVAYQLWAELENDANEQLMLTTGGLDMGVRGHPEFEACVKYMTEEDVSFQFLGPAELKERFPQFELAEGMVGVYQGDAGVLSASKCVKAMVRIAEKLGATVLSNTEVLGLNTGTDRITLDTIEKQYSCKKLIVAGGPWANKLLGHFGMQLPLVISKEQFLYFKPMSPALFNPARCPVYINYSVNRTGNDIDFYGFPMLDIPGVKVAEHHAGPITTADTRTFELDEEGVKRLTARALATLPNLTNDIVASGTCLYTTTPDRNFFIDTLPGDDRIVIAAGFSGHGFKFAPAIGRMLSELADDGTSRLSSELFRFSRYDIAASKPS